MNTLERISGWVWEASWQAALIAVVVFVAQRLLRTRLSAGWRYALWFLVVARLVMPVLPQSPVSVYNFTPRVERVPVLAAPVTAAVPTSSATLAVPSAPAAIPPPQPKFEWRQLIPILSAVWALGAILLGLRLVFGTQLFMRRARRLSRATSPTLRGLLDETVKMMGTKRPLIMETAAVITPTLAGIWSPRILLPAGISERLSVAELRHVLLHELAHVKRRDVAMNWVVNALLAVHWFNPLLWLAFRQMRADREIACDEIALRALRGDERSAYGETLIKVSDGMPAAGAWMGMVGIFESQDQLEKRIRAIVTGRNVPRYAALLGAVLALAVAAVALTDAADRGKTARNVQTEKKADTAASKAAISGSARIVEAAKSGDEKKLKDQTVLTRNYLPDHIAIKVAEEALNSLVTEKAAFAAALSELRYRVLLPDWQPSSQLLEELLKNNQRDSIEILIAGNLDMDLLAKANSKVPNEQKWVEQRLIDEPIRRSIQNQLTTAARTADIDAIDRLLDAGAHIDGPDKDGLTPLLAASDAGKTEAVRHLLSRGAIAAKAGLNRWRSLPITAAANPETAQVLKDADPESFKRLAASKENVVASLRHGSSLAVLKWFLDEGFDPTGSIEGVRPTLLFDTNSPEVAQMLIEHGVDVNAVDDRGRTALFEAVQYPSEKSLKMAEMLLKHGANPNARDSSGTTPIMAASDAATVELLIAAGADLTARNNNGESVWKYQGDNQSTDRGSALRRHGVKMAAPDEGVAALMDATFQGKTDDVRKLIQEGVDPGRISIGPDQYPEESAMSRALTLGRNEILEVMRKAGGKDVGELTEAAARGDLERMRHLLRDGANVNETTSFGMTPLFFAVRQYQVEAVRLLMKNGADPSIFDHNGWTPITLAEQVIPNAMYRGYSAEEKISNAEAAKICHEMLALMEPAFSAPRKDSEGNTSMTMAASHGIGFGIRSAISRGEDVNYQRPDGMSALMLAIVSKPKNAGTDVVRTFDLKTGETSRGSLASRVIRELLDGGADKELRNREGKTALDLAKERNDEESIVILSPQSSSGNSAKLDQELLKAIGAEDEEKVRAAIDAGADVNQINKSGNSLLMTAAAQGSLPMVKLLLEKGADLNQKSIQSGYNATYFSASAQQPEVLEYLISKGGDLDTGAIKGSALSVALAFAPGYPGPEATKEMRAEFEGRLRKTIDVLIKSGMDLEIRDGVDGFTPLAQAVAFGLKIPMEMLIAAGAKIDAKDGAGATPLTRSMLPYFGAAPRFDVAEYLLDKGVSINAGNDNPSTEREFPSPLKAAMIGGFMHPNAGAIEPLRAGAKMLIARGAKFAMPDGTDEAELMKAAAQGDSNAVSRLLAKGVSANVFDTKGWTPLMTACALGYSEIARNLIQAGADVNAKDASGFTALWLASTNDPNKEDIRLLIEKKADPNPAPPAFGGILLRLVDRKDPALLKELLAAGSDPNVGLYRSVPYFALAGAIHAKQMEMALDLIKAGADPNPRCMENRTPVFWAVSRQLPEVVRALIDAGAKLDIVTDYGETVVSEAERRDDKDILRMLTDAQAGKTAAAGSSGGTSALNAADELVSLAGKGDAEGIKRLLEKGADIDAVNSSKLTPLGAAAKAGNHGVVKLLLSRGAKVDKPGTLGYTPLALAKTVEVARALKEAGADLNAKTVGEDRILSYAVRFGSPEVVQWFLENGADPKIATSDPNFPTLLFHVRDPRIAEILMRHGVDPLVENQIRDNAIFFATVGNPDATRMIQIFLNHGLNPKIKDTVGTTLLMLAPDAAGIDALVRAGADINARTTRGATAWTLVGNISQPGRDEALIRHGLAKPAIEEEGGLFFDAINQSDLTKLKRLLKDGADPDSREGLGGAMHSSRMSIALAWGFPEGVAEMRKAGGKDVGELSEAAGTGDLARMRALLAAGASINEATAAGFTPLLFATQRCQLEAVKFLIENGADSEMFDERGETALSLAEGLHALIQADSSVDSVYSPVVHVSRKDVETFCAEALPLLRKSRSSERRNSAGETALCKAAYQASFPTLSSLLSNGADINAQRTDGMTPLMLAVIGKPPESLQTVTITNPRSGESKRLTAHGNAVETLLAAGADTALRNNAGKTAMDLAEERKDEELGGIFRRVGAARAPADSQWMNVASKQPMPAKGSYRERILVAARSGAGKEIEKIITESYEAPVGIREEEATEMIDSLLVSREFGAFTVLLDQMLQTNLGKNWQANDELLAGLVKDGRTDFLDVLLARRLDPERLRRASAAGDSKTKAWIARRTDAVQKARKGIDDLIEACAQGNVEEARKLLDAGVNVNGRTSKDDSWTPLTRASAADKPEVVKLLLGRGADPNLPKLPGWDYTPLCLAESAEVCQMLKDAGGDVDATLFKRPTSILTYVAMFNGAKVVQWFFDQGLDPKMIGDNDQTLLFNAKDVETVELLLSAGVDPNHLDEFGKSALHYARNGDTVRALIKGGARLTGFKEPILVGMIQMSQGDAVNSVLESGIKIDQKDLQRALLTASFMDREGAAKALLEAGAKANEPGEWGPANDMLPLTLCCVSGSEKTAKILLEYGADPNGGDGPGFFLQTASLNNQKEMVEILRKAGAKGASDLAAAVITDDQAQISALLETAPDFADQPEFWWDVVKNAAARGNLEVMKAALAKGAPLTHTAETGSYSGYYSAAWEGQSEILRLMLDKKPAPEPGKLIEALYTAVSNSHPRLGQRPAKDFEECIDLLIKAGAIKNLDPERDWLMRAAIYTGLPGGNARVMEMLAAAGANPNPADQSGKKLSEMLNETCTTPNCVVPSETVLETFEKLANVKIERGAER